jgi:hypothetical protein
LKLNPQRLETRVAYGALSLAKGRESYQLQKTARVTVKSRSMGLLFIYSVMATCSLVLVGAIGAMVYYLLTRWTHHL